MRKELYGKIYLNPILGSIILQNFIFGYGKNISLKTASIILPLIFDDKIFNKLVLRKPRSNFYTLISENYLLDIRNEIHLKKQLTHQSIIYGANKNLLTLQNSKIKINGEQKSYKSYKSGELREIIKASQNLGIILAKIKNENELFYHLIKY